MNINDFADIEIPAGDMLATIFNHQRDLMDKYHAIESANVGHWIPSSPHEPVDFPAVSTGAYKWGHAGALDINDRHSQLRLKDFAWRITEELTEATEALDEGNEVHFLEELIDALHFSVELLCLCGIETDNLMFKGPLHDCLEELFEKQESSGNSVFGANIRDTKIQTYLVVENLGRAMNMLKLKPWKTTAMITDVHRFKSTVCDFFLSLISLLSDSGLDAKSTTKMYLQKNAVNQFRQRSRY